MRKVKLPHQWTERPYQERLWEYLVTGGKRALAVWHRRAGKDDVALHYAACSMHERVGNVWHCLPEYQQGRKALWTAVNPHTGKRRIDEAFPKILRASTNDTEMFIRFLNGSTWQIIGSDRYDATVGAGPVGIVYSEWALSNPSAWAYHRPMLTENDGWALFITTPRGRNHAHAMARHAEHSPEWFYQCLTAVDTGALSHAKLDEALAEYKALFGEDAGQAQYDQEYLCSFNAAILGAIYARDMAQVRAEGRVLPIEADPDQLVHRAWDLGVDDDTSIWWFQVHGAQILILDHYASNGVGVEHYAEVIEQRAKQYGWRNGSDFVPHDAKVKEWGSGRTRVETMSKIGLKPDLVPLASVQDGINAARRTLPLCVFHPRTDETGMAALEQYRREWDDEHKCFKPTAVHDWTSHPADSFRYLALSWRRAPKREIVVPQPAGFIIPPPPEKRRGISL